MLLPEKSMTYAEMDLLAQEFGFSKAYCLGLAPLAQTWDALCRERPPHTNGLCVDPAAEYPWASAVVLLLRAYQPFPPESELPGYYIASNAGYHAANALCKSLIAKEFRAEHIEVPLPALVVQANVGTLCKNAMLDIDGFGTRTALFTIVTDACTPQTQLSSPPPPCGSCRMCADACPVHAIDPATGLNSSLCLRTYMENAPMPEMVMENIPGLLGCEICQYACPRNRPIGVHQPTEAESAASDIASILRGNTAPARDLVGKNMCGGGRLLAQAAALAGKNKRADLIEEVRALLDHPKQAVRDAAQWAVQKLTDI